MQTDCICIESLFHTVSDLNG